MLYDNNWAPVTLRQDGSAYVGALNGLIRIKYNPNENINVYQIIFYDSYIIPLIIGVITAIVFNLLLSRLIFIHRLQRKKEKEC